VLLFNYQHTLKEESIMIKQSRWSSKLLWAAIIAQVIAIGQLTGIFERIGIDAGLVGDVSAAILQLLVIIGVVNDPTNKEGW
jgi:uncharacterized membrane protein